MKKKIIALGAVIVLVIGLFVFKNFFVKNKDENTSNNTVTENQNKNTDSKKESSTNNDSSKKEETKNESQSNEKLTLESLKSQKKVMILDFSQNGWHACAIQHKVLEKLREEYKDRVIIQTINIRKEMDFTSQFPIRVTPTLFYFNADGTPFESPEELASKINYVAYEDKKSGELKFGGSEGVVQYEDLKAVIEEMLKNAK